MNIIITRSPSYPITIPRADEVLVIPVVALVFSVLDLFAELFFTQLIIHPDAIPLTAFCTPNGLNEWLRNAFRYGRSRHDPDVS